MIRCHDVSQLTTAELSARQARTHGKPGAGQARFTFCRAGAAPDARH